jgi:nicotinamidase-related amidase
MRADGARRSLVSVYSARAERRDKGFQEACASTEENAIHTPFEHRTPEAQLRPPRFRSCWQRWCVDAFVGFAELDLANLGRQVLRHFAHIVFGLRTRRY